MHLKSLKIYCDVVNRRSFSRAATENGISQSGVSQVIHQLEDRLGVKLLDRSKRPFLLTQEGEIYYEGSRRLVERYVALEERVRTLHAEVSGRVRVASIYSVGLHHMDRYLQEFMAQHPKANVRLEYLHPQQVIEAIKTDQADVGLVSFPKSSRSIQCLAWRDEPMALVTAPSHRLAGESSLRIEALEGEKMIGFDRDLTIRRKIDQMLAAHQVEIETVMEFDNIETIKRAVEIDAGVALLPLPTVARETAAGTLSAMKLTGDDAAEITRPLGIIHRRGKELSMAVRGFIELLQKCEMTDSPDERMEDDSRIGSAEPCPTESAPEGAEVPHQALSDVTQEPLEEAIRANW